MELDINLILEKYKRRCADLQEENIMLNTQNEMLFRRIAELEAPKPEEPKDKKGVK